jgi:hypothetical protein
MQTLLHTNATLDVNNVYMIHCIELLSVQRLFRCNECERQQSVHDFKSYTSGTQWAALSHPSKANVEVSVIAKKANDPLVATSSK